MWSSPIPTVRRRPCPNPVVAAAGEIRHTILDLLDPAVMPRQLQRTVGQHPAAAHTNGHRPGWVSGRMQTCPTFRLPTRGCC